MPAPKAISTMDSRQKVIAVVFVLILLFLAWLVYGMFSSGSSSAPPAIQSATSKPLNASGGGMPTGPALPKAPQPAELPKQPAPLTPRETQLLQMQQETEMKYLTALNELQMLKIERDIAETNKAIAAAKFDTVTAQKNTLNLLKPPAPVPTPASYAQGLVSPTGAAVGPPQGMIRPPSEPEANYTVISVSFLRQQWNAVIGYQGNLYSVHIGDILPVDGSRVVRIDKSGLILEKNGIERKISMVPII